MTKRDVLTHKIPPLAIEQMNAIDQLVIGLTDREVAEKVGVARQTVTKWRLYHPGFQAELNKRRREVWGTAADRLRSMLPKALDRIEKTLLDDNNSNSWRAAFELLKAAGLHADDDRRLVEMGEDEPEKIIERLARNEMSPQDFVSMGINGHIPEYVKEETVAKLLAKLNTVETETSDQGKTE